MPVKVTSRAALAMPAAKNEKENDEVRDLKLFLELPQTMPSKKN